MEEKNNKKKEITLDKLALIAQNGFLEVKTEIKTEIVKAKEELRAEIKEVREELSEVKSDTEEIKKELVKKVDVFTYNDLKYRVEKLEKKFA